MSTFNQMLSQELEVFVFLQIAPKLTKLSGVGVLIENDDTKFLIRIYASVSLKNMNTSAVIGEAFSNKAA